MAPIRRCTFPRTIRRVARPSFDFTHGDSLGVTVSGEPYPHLLFQLILSHSGWRYAEVAATKADWASRIACSNSTGSSPDR